jgi:hypothetical protein
MSHAGCSVEPIMSEAGPIASEAGAAPDSQASLWTAPAECLPQQAMSDGTECAATAGFAWNGAGCAKIECGCAGADCNAIHPTLTACQAAFAACHPASSCSDDWFACSDVCPSQLVLRGGGRSFGECTGDCYFELHLDTPIVLDVGGCSELMATLRIRNTETGERLVNFSPTRAAWQEATLISLALQDETVDPVTSCPDCPADVGAAWIVRAGDSASQTEERFNYAFRSPPRALHAADAFVQQLIEEARQCQGDHLVNCTTSDAADNTIEPHCGTVNGTSCTCPVPFESLSTLDGTSCDGSCEYCQVPDSTCGASCVRSCSSGDQRWKAQCAE